MAILKLGRKLVALNVSVMALHKGQFWPPFYAIYRTYNLPEMQVEKYVCTDDIGNDFHRIEGILSQHLDTLTTYFPNSLVLNLLFSCQRKTC